MPLLNPPRALPSVLQSMVAALVREPNQGLTEDRLGFVLSPPPLRDSPDKLPGATEDTITAFRGMGLLEKEGDRLRLSRDFVELLPRRQRADPDAIRHATRRFLLMPPSANEDQATRRAEDFALAAAWFLQQDPLDPPVKWDTPRHGVGPRQDEQLVEKVLINDTRWGAFERWAPYLGLAVHDRRVFANKEYAALVPEPTVAVRDELRRLLGQASGERGLHPTLADLGAACPVLDGGEYAAEVDRRRRPGKASAPVAGYISQALSAALLLLQEEGTIRLFDRADAAKVLVSIDGQTTESYSHVLWSA